MASPAVQKILEAAESLRGVDFDAAADELAHDRGWIDDHDALRCQRALVTAAEAGRVFSEAVSVWRQRVAEGGFRSSAMGQCKRPVRQQVYVVVVNGVPGHRWWLDPAAAKAWADEHGGKLRPAVLEVARG